MKLLLQSAMIFFGTLMTAAVVALGEPAQADVAIATSAVDDPARAQYPIEVAANQAGLGRR